MSPSLAVELARLVLARASSEAVERCLAREASAPALASVLAVGERARAAGASEEQTALALGVLEALRTRETPEVARRE